MTNHELEIIMKLKDEVTKKLQGIEGGIRRFANSVNVMGRNLKQFGRDLTQIGSTMAFMGAVITGPLILAFKNADKYSASVHNQIERLSNITNVFQVQLAQALVPVIDKLVNLLGYLLNLWNSLGTVQQQAIVQGIFLTGVFLTIGGAVVALAGKLFRLGGIIFGLIAKLALFATVHPVIAIIVGIVITLTIVFIKFRDVATNTLNAIEIGVQMVYIGFVKLIQYILIGFDKILLGLQKFYDLLGKLPGKLGEPYREASKNLQQFRGNLEGLIKGADTEMENSGKKMEKIFTTGKGSLAEGWENLNTKIKVVWDKLKNPPPINIKPLTERLESLQEITTKIFSAMERSVSDFFYNSITQKTFKLIDFFRQLGQSIIRIWTDMLAKMITRWIQAQTTMQSASGGSSANTWVSILGKVAGLFSGMGSSTIQGGVGGQVVSTGQQSVGGHSFTSAWTPYHTGGPIRAHSGLAVDEVPIIARRGEYVLSEKGVAAAGGVSRLKRADQGESISEKQNINNYFYIQAQDAQSFLRYKPQIIAVINEAMDKNLPLRSTIKARTR